jgi:hypothetical protein
VQSSQAANATFQNFVEKTVSFFQFVDASRVRVASLQPGSIITSINAFSSPSYAPMAITGSNAKSAVESDVVSNHDSSSISINAHQTSIQSFVIDGVSTTKESMHLQSIQSTTSLNYPTASDLPLVSLADQISFDLTDPFSFLSSLFPGRFLDVTFFVNLDASNSTSTTDFGMLEVILYILIPILSVILLIMLIYYCFYFKHPPYEKRTVEVADDDGNNQHKISSIAVSEDIFVKNKFGIFGANSMGAKQSSNIISVIPQISHKFSHKKDSIKKDSNLAGNFLVSKNGFLAKNRTESPSEARLINLNSNGFDDDNINDNIDPDENAGNININASSRPSSANVRSLPFINIDIHTYTFFLSLIPFIVQFLHSFLHSFIPSFIH